MELQINATPGAPTPAAPPELPPCEPLVPENIQSETGPPARQAWICGKLLVGVMELPFTPLPPELLPAAPPVLKARVPVAPGNMAFDVPIVPAAAPPPLPPPREPQ